MKHNKQWHLTFKDWKTMTKVFDNSTGFQGILKSAFKNNIFNTKKIKNRRSRQKEVAAMENN